MMKVRATYRATAFAALWMLLATVLPSACKKPMEVDQGELAAHAAQLYYAALAEGRVDDFVDGISVADSTDYDYHKLLLANTKMFLKQQKQEHRGIRKADIVGSAYNDKTATANVFLMLTFGDGNTEQMLVPMVRKGELWLMK